jgi:hypothetical protein
VKQARSSRRACRHSQVARTAPSATYIEPSQHPGVVVYKHGRSERGTPPAQAPFASGRVAGIQQASSGPIVGLPQKLWPRRAQLGCGGAPTSATAQSPARRAFIFFFFLLRGCARGKDGAGRRAEAAAAGEARRVQQGPPRGRQGAPGAAPHHLPLRRAAPLPPRLTNRHPPPVNPTPTC